MVKNCVKLVWKSKTQLTQFLGTFQVTKKIKIQGLLASISNAIDIIDAM